MEGFADYGHAIIAMAAVAVFQLLLSPLSALRKTSAGVVPGAQPPADYADACYRWDRAYGNLTENMGPFVAVTVAAILAGAAPFWVNLFAALFLMARLVVAAVHVTGMGKPERSVRSFTYVAGWLMCLSLAYLAIKAVLTGG